MSKLQKLKRKLRENPRGIRFTELVRVLKALGYEESRSQGSHHVYRPAGSGPSILIVKPHGGSRFCARVDIEKVVKLLAEEGGNEE